MSKLFDDASLAMIPSAYKDGKLYSIRPTDGSGDFTFSRGSNLAATRVDVNGLIEKGRENLLLQSNQFDTTWVEAGNSGIITSGFAGYDGTNDAWQLEHKGSQYTSIRQTLSSSGVQTYSLYAKAGTLDYVIVYAQSSVSPRTWFNLSNGTIGSQQGSTIDASIESVGSGWYRCTISFSDTLGGVRIYPNDGNGTFGTTSGTIYIQDAQLEQGLVATDYIETTTTSVSAGILEDMPRLDYSGSCPSLLLEPQRTNLVTQSEYFDASYWNKEYVTITNNAAISPEGVNNSTKLVENATNQRHRIYTYITTTSGTNYTFSVFVKKNSIDRFLLINAASAFGARSVLNLDTLEITNINGTSGKVENFSNGWYRFSISGQATTSSFLPIFVQLQNAASDVPYLGNGSSLYLYGAQIESGSYPTSYIPTYGTSQTRLGGMFSNTSLNLQDDGILGSTWTFLYDNTYVDVVRDAGANLFQIESVTSGEYVRISLNSGGTYRLQDGDGTIANTSGNKILGRYDGTKVEFFVDGASIGSRTSTAGRYSDLDRFEPSTSVTKIVKLNQLLFFPTALTDSECIALTTL